MNADLDRRYADEEHGAYAFRIHRSVHHLINSELIPNENNIIQQSRFAQIYIFDSANELQNRMNFADNRWIMPHSLFLAAKYNAYINVEICTQFNYVKYVYKYIYKGHDRAQLHLGDNNNERRDAIKNYLDARYVSTAEACWRFYSFPMHKESPAYQRLDVRLPGYCLAQISTFLFQTIIMVKITYNYALCIYYQLQFTQENTRDDSVTASPTPDASQQDPNVDTTTNTTTAGPISTNFTAQTEISTYANPVLDTAKCELFWI